MFEKFFSRFINMPKEGPAVFSAEQLETWPQEEVASLKKLGFLKKAAPAKTVECPGCENGCLMPVNVYPAQEVRPARLFVACDKRDDTGRVLIESKALEQWQIDIPRFTSLLASALGIDQAPDEILPQQAYYLGALTINQKRRSAFFVVNEAILNYALESDLFGRYGQPFFFVPAGGKGKQEIKHAQTIIFLRHLLLSSDTNSLSLDFSMLEQLIFEGDSRRVVAAISAGEKVTERNIFRREGQMWTLCYGGVTKHFKHSKGLLYISYLLGSPFQEYHVAELVKVAENPGKEVLSFSASEVSTKKTIENYRKRLSEIRAELSDADDTGDPLLKKELHEEKQAVEQQILQAVGLAGKLRKHPDETKRQANAVSEAISRSLKVIRKSHPSLQRHLFNAINRGEYLSYIPETNISWITMQ